MSKLYVNLIISYFFWNSMAKFEVNIHTHPQKVRRNFSKEGVL